MARMDLSDSQIFGDEIDIWDPAPDLKKDEPEKATGRSKRKKMDAQDRVVLLQAVLALIVVLLFLAVKFVFPKLHETFNEQYTEFNTKPPLFDLDDIKRLVIPETSSIPSLPFDQNFQDMRALPTAEYPFGTFPC